MPTTSGRWSRLTTCLLLVALAALVWLLGGPEPSAHADSNNRPTTTDRASSTPPLLLARSASPSWAYGKASAYGPGLWGNSTACGQTLTRRTVGVAHRYWRCGQRVTVCHRGRCAAVRVIDRGPFVRGRVLDLTEGTTRRVWNVSARQWGVRTVRYRKGW